MVQIKFRCMKCGTILTTSDDNFGKKGICSKCKSVFTISRPKNKNDRKYERAIAEKNKFSISLPKSLVKTNVLQSYKIIYTETDPIQFVVKRKNSAPLLDISKNGLAFYIKTGKASTGIFPKKIIIIELDFPILDEPLRVGAEVQWVIHMQNPGLLRIGVEFSQPGRELTMVVEKLIKYMLTRPKRWDTIYNPVLAE